MYLFNPERAIEAVYPEVEKFGGIFAGGIVCDKYFKKQTKDIDVFVHEGNLELVMKFVEKNKFQMKSQPTGHQKFGRNRMIPRGYGSVNRKTNENPVHSVYGGYYLGYPMDVVVTREDPIKHVTKAFDQNIKSCYYNGKYNYTKAFNYGVLTKTVAPLSYDIAGYVRATLSAEKYDLSISPLYDLSKDFLQFILTEHPDHVPNYVSEKNLPHFNVKKLFGNRTYNKANAMIADTFVKNYGNRSAKQSVIKKYRHLCEVATREQLSDHMLTNISFDVTTPPGALYSFVQTLQRIESILRPNGLFFYSTEEEKDRINEDHEKFKQIQRYLQPLMFVNKESFMEGKIDFEGRTVKINKLLNTMYRKHKDLLEPVESLIKDAQTYVQDRSVKLSYQVKFTAAKDELMHISTNTEWTSCQRWNYLDPTPQSYGLLANLSGATLVGQFLHPEAKRGVAGRFLIRVGQDGSLLFESIYSTRDELRDASVMKQIQDALKGAGFKLRDQYKTKGFISKNLMFVPYNDMCQNIHASEIKGQGYYFMSADMVDQYHQAYHAMRVLNEQIQQAQEQRAFNADDPFAGADVDGDVANNDFPF